MYLHEIAPDEQSFTQTEMNEQKHKDYENYLLDDFQEREDIRLEKAMAEECWRSNSG